MSNPLNNPNSSAAAGGSGVRRDYGAMASTSGGGTSSTAAAMPDVSFSGFSPTEFMSLSEDIAHNITAINSSCKQLEKMLKLVGTPRDLPALREKVHNLLAKTNTRIESNSKDLQRLTAVVRRGDKQQKLQLEKLTNDFRNVLEKYSTLQQRITIAIKQSYQKAAAAAALQDADNDAASAMQTQADRAELLQHQRETQANLQFEHDMLVERERQVKQIESDILDVNSIMRTLSGLVHAQAEQVENIESSIEQASGNVEEGRAELAKAAEHRQSYRRKILILLAIAVIIGLIVTGIIIGKLNS